MAGQEISFSSAPRFGELSADRATTNGGGLATVSFQGRDQGEEDIFAQYMVCEGKPGGYLQTVTTAVTIEPQNAAILYNHSLTNSSGGFAQTVTATGSVSFGIDDSDAVVGTGTVPLTLSGSVVAGDMTCTISGGGEMIVHLSGSLVQGAEGALELQLTFQETWYAGGSATMTMVCTDPDGTNTSTTQIPESTNNYEQTFLYEAGHTVTGPYSGAAGSGTVSWTLQL